MRNLKTFQVGFFIVTYMTKTRAVYVRVFIWVSKSDVYIDAVSTIQIISINSKHIQMLS